MVEGGIEHPLQRAVGSAYAYAAQFVVPRTVCGGFGLVEVDFRGFGHKICHGVFDRGARNGGGHGYLFAFGGVEKESGILRLGVRAYDRIVQLHSVEGAREAAGKPHFLVACPAVGEAVSGHCHTVDDVYFSRSGGVPVHGLAEIQNHGGLASGHGVALEAYARCGGEFDVNTIVVECNFVVAGAGGFAVVVEFAVNAQRSIANLDRSGHRHERNIVKVAGSGTAQMGMREAGDGGVGVEISRNTVPAGQTVVGAQLHHAERRLCTGVGVAGEVGAYHGVDQRSRVKCRVVGSLLLALARYCGKAAYCGGGAKGQQPDGSVFVHCCKVE